MAEAADFLITYACQIRTWAENAAWHLELVDPDENLVIRIPNTLQGPDERDVEVLPQHFTGQRRIADLSHTYYLSAPIGNRTINQHMINMVGLIPHAYRSYINHIT
jgi:hypothetical protein